jgi:hypothetical protein
VRALCAYVCVHEALKIEVFHVPLQTIREVFLVNILDYPVATDVNIAFFFFFFFFC